MVDTRGSPYVVSRIILDRAIIFFHKGFKSRTLLMPLSAYVNGKFPASTDNTDVRLKTK
jgi:hypothetical protein